MRNTPYAMSPADAARWIGVSRSTIYRLIQSGEIPTVKVGRRTILPTHHLEAFIERKDTSRPKQSATPVVAAAGRPSSCQGFRAPSGHVRREPMAS